MGQLWASPVVEVMERIISLRHGLYLPAEARARPAPGLEVEGSGVVEVRAKSIPARGDRARFLGVPGGRQAGLRAAVGEPGPLSGEAKPAMANRISVD